MFSVPDFQSRMSAGFGPAGRVGRRGASSSGEEGAAPVPARPGTCNKVEVCPGRQEGALPFKQLCPGPFADNFLMSSDFFSF